MVKILGRAALAGCVPAIRNGETTTMPVHLISHLTTELESSDIGDMPSQPSVGHHCFDIQILDDHFCELAAPFFLKRGLRFFRC